MRTVRGVLVLLSLSLMGTVVVGQCDADPGVSATTITLMSDPDGVGRAFNTPKAGCTWSVSCGEIDGANSSSVMMITAAGLMTYVSVRASDVQGGKWSAGGFVVAKSTAEGLVSDWVAPMTIRTLYTADFRTDYPGITFTIKCLPRFDETEALMTRRAIVVPQVGEAHPVVMSYLDFRLPAGATDGVGTVEYLATCESPNQRVAFDWIGSSGDLISTSVRTRDGVNGNFFGVTARDGARYGSGQLWVRFRTAQLHQVNLTTTFTCTDDQYFDCSSTWTGEDVVMTLPTNGTDFSPTAHMVSDIDGHGGSEPVVERPCAVHVRCATPATHDVVLDEMFMIGATKMEISLTGADGLTRAIYPRGSRNKFGVAWQGLLSGPMRGGYFAPDPSAGVLTETAAYPLDNARTSLPAPPGNTGVSLRFELVAPYTGGFTGVGMSAKFRCRRRGLVRVEPTVKVVDAMARKVLNVSAETPVSPSFAQGLPSASVVGTPYTFSVSNLDDREQRSFSRGRTEWTQYATQVQRIPVDCGAAANIDLRVAAISGWQTSRVISALQYGRGDLVRLVGGGRLGSSDALLHDIGTASSLLTGPAEIQWVSGRPGTASVSDGNANVLKTITFEATCTLDGRNGPPWPGVSERLFFRDWGPKSTAVVTWEVFAQRSNLALPPLQEPKGRVDAISSDRDGIRSGVDTDYSLNVTINCPRRFRPCRICLQGIASHLHRTLRFTASAPHQQAEPIDIIARYPGIMDTNGLVYAFETHICTDGGMHVALIRTPASPPVSGFTLEFYPDLSNAISVPRTQSVTLSRSLPVTGTAVSSRTPTSTMTPSIPATTTTSLPATRSVSSTLSPVPTRSALGTATSTHSASLSATISPIVFPVIPPAPSDLASVTAVTGPMGASAVAAAGAFGIGTPSSASQPSRLAGAGAVMRCGDGLDEPSMFEHPFAWVPIPAPHEPRVSSEDASLALEVFRAAVSTTGLTLLITIVPFLYVTAFGNRKSTPRSNFNGIVLGLATAFFGPSAASASASLLFRGLYIPILATCIVLVPIGALAALGIMLARELSVERATGRPSSTKSRHAAVVNGFAGGTRTDILVHATSDARWALTRGYFMVDAGSACLFAIVTGLRPSGPQAPTLCMAVALAGLVVSLGFAAYLATMRPLQDRVEGTFAMIVAGGQVVLGIIGVVYVVSRMSWLLVAFEVVEMLLTFVLVMQSVALTIQYCRGELRQGSNAATNLKQDKAHGSGAADQNTGGGDSNSSRSTSFDETGDPLLDVPRLVARMHGTVVNGVDGEDRMARYDGALHAPMLSPEAQARINVAMWDDDSPAQHNPLAVRHNIDALNAASESDD